MLQLDFDIMKYYAKLFYLYKYGYDTIREKQKRKKLQEKTEGDTKRNRIKVDKKKFF